MALPVWGNLNKSQIDPETIEEAIARLIQSHEDDPNAHIEAGESLQSHKASEVIDHIVASIIADKVRDGEISPRKLNMRDIYIAPSLETLLGWTSVNEGSGGTIYCFVSGLEMKPGDAIGNKTYASIPMGGFLECNAELSPTFEFKAIFYDYGIADFKVKVRGSNPFDDTANGFGFECLKADAVVYAFYTIGSSKTRIALAGITPQTWRHYRIESVYDSGSGNSVIKYYVDDVLVHTYSDIAMTFASDTCISAGTRQQTALSEEGQFAIRDVVYTSDYI